MTIFQWLATGFSLLYLYYAVRNRSICFVFGLIGSLLWAYESYFNYYLVFDAGLQLFYAAISLWGLYLWTSKKQQAVLPIKAMTVRDHRLWIFLGLTLFGTFLLASRWINHINMPVLDGISTAYLIVGSFLLIFRKLESWLYLVAADILYLYIYGMQEAWLFLGVMIVYIIFGIVGYKEWKVFIENEKD